MERDEPFFVSRVMSFPSRWPGPGQAGLLVGLFRVLGAFSGQVPELARMEPELEDR